MFVDSTVQFLFFLFFKFFCLKFFCSRLFGVTAGLLPGILCASVKFLVNPSTTFTNKFLSFCLLNFVKLTLCWYEIKLFWSNLPSNMKKIFLFHMADFVSCKKYISSYHWGQLHLIMMSSHFWTAPTWGKLPHCSSVHYLPP